MSRKVSPNCKKHWISTGISVEDRLVSHFFLIKKKSFFLLREELGKLLEKICRSRLILFVDVVGVSENEKLWAEMEGVEIELC